MLQIKGAPVSYQEVKSYKSHFIHLFIRKAFEDTAEVGPGTGVSCPGLFKFPSREPKPLMWRVSPLLPSLPVTAHTITKPETIHPPSRNTDWTNWHFRHLGVQEWLHPCQHPCGAEWGRGGGAGLVCRYSSGIKGLVTRFEGRRGEEPPKGNTAVSCCNVPTMRTFK